MKIQFSEPEWLNTEIAGEETLGGIGPNSDAELDRFARRASVGRPIVRPLTPDLVALEPAERAFIAESGALFHLVELAFSIYPEDAEKLEMATLAVLLEDGAVAWSLAPLRATEALEVSGFGVGGEIAVGPALKIEGHWAPPEQQEHCWVYALGEREADPEWRLRRRGSVEITGPHRFALVVRVEGQADIGGTVGLTARFDRKGRVFRGRASLSAQESDFVLPARPASSR